MLLRTISQSLKTGVRRFDQLNTIVGRTCAIPARYYSDGKVVIPVVEYREIKDLPNHPEKLLIDVREPKELKETGIIPTSINIPLGTVPYDLQPSVDANTFHKKFGRQKPSLSTELIFTCRSGKRAQDAAEIAAKFGYKNVKNYKGSWLDWAEHEGLPK